MLHTPRRYQLNKIGLRIIRNNHPWIFRDQLSSAASAFKNGEWLSLVDSNNEIVAYGVYDLDGIIGIRVFKWGEQPPTLGWLKKRLQRAIEKRESLRSETDAVRLLHGENDGVPGVVFDLYDDVGVLATYARSVDAIGRYVARFFCERLGLRSVVWKLPVKRHRSEAGDRFRRLYGASVDLVSFREGDRCITVDIAQGQKTGFFLDLRNLRRWLNHQPWNGARVLNLFCYTGTLGQAAAAGGASLVRNIDVAPAALAFGRSHHGGVPMEWSQRDIFDWLKEKGARERFDLVILDPPSMASQMSHVKSAMASYRKLLRGAAERVGQGGTLVTCCCTSRITRREFGTCSDEVLGSAFHFVSSLPPEPDHPTTFPEGDYLKVLIYKRRNC